jgi:uncharacterized protein (DUF885 family)
MMAARSIAAAMLLCLLAACAGERPRQAAPSRAQPAALVPVMENRIAETLLQSAIHDIAAASPETRTRLDIDGDNGKWDSVDDLSREQMLLHHASLVDSGVAIDKLGHTNRIKVELLRYAAARARDAIAWPDYRYPVNSVNGPQIRLPTFLIDAQPTRTRKDFENYIARIAAMASYVDDSIAAARRARHAGMVLPETARTGVTAQCTALLAGRPFEELAEDSPLLADFDTRLRLSNLDADRRRELKHVAAGALRDSLAPACRSLAAYMREDTDPGTEGVWALPDGAAFYARQVAWYTSMDLTPEQVHGLAMDEMAKIETRLDEATRNRLRDDPALRLRNDEDSVQDWLNRIGGYVFELDADLPAMIAPLPDTDLEIRATASFQADPAVKAHYVRASPASPVGICYFNLAAMRSYEVEALTYRFTIPGEHAIPPTTFSLIFPVPAFSQGWGLYSMRLPSAPGHFSAPLADAGRLIVEARAVSAAVIDTGVHFEKWSRDDAVKWLLGHLPVERAEAEIMVDHVLMSPGAATAALAGLHTIERLRQESESRLGDAFSLVDFHRVVLQDGPVPMPVLVDNVKRWLDGAVAGKMHASPNARPGT